MSPERDEAPTVATGEASGTSGSASSPEDNAAHANAQRWAPIGSNHRVIAELGRLSYGRLLRVSIADAGRRPGVFLLAWHRDAAGEYQPGAGPTLRREHLARIISALQQAAQELGRD